MNIKTVLVALCSLLFFMIGADKFLNFLEPPCSMMTYIPTTVWQVLGAVQIISGVLIWLPKYQKYVASFFCVFMIVFAIVHLTQGTYDIGGAAAMAVKLGIISWDPPFINGKKKS